PELYQPLVRPVEVANCRPSVWGDGNRGDFKTDVILRTSASCRVRTLSQEAIRFVSESLSIFPPQAHTRRRHELQVMDHEGSEVADYSVRISPLPGLHPVVRPARPGRNQHGTDRSGKGGNHKRAPGKDHHRSSAAGPTGQRRRLY